MDPVGWRERVGVGQRQPNDAHVTDQTRTRKLILPGEHEPSAAELILHKSGRIDATVKPATVVVSRDEVEQVKRDLGMDDREMLDALNNIFGTRKKAIRYERR